MKERYFMYDIAIKIGTIITGNSTKKYIIDIEGLIELSKVVAKHNKIVTAHIRNENDSVFESIKELIDNAREEINISIEQYTYNAYTTGLSAVLPNWVHDGGIIKEGKATIVRPGKVVLSID